MTAAYGGGGIGLAGAFAAGLLYAQAKLARHAIPITDAPPPRCDGRYGTEQPGEPLTLLVFGDSSAAGYGVELPQQTPGALLASGLAERLRRPVDVHSFAVVGATSSDLPGQLARAGGVRADLAVILIGANDVTHLVKAPIAVRHLADAVRDLRADGAEVVVGTCPDLGTIGPIQPPLRWLARRMSRQMAAVQTIAVVEAGGRTVSLGDLLGPRFAAAPDRMFSADRFHPSAAGYAAAVEAILPTAVAALAPVEDQRPSAARGEHVRSLPQAAVEAVDRAGTEVSGAEVAGRERGPAGRWAQLRHRVRMVVARPTGPATSDNAAVPSRGSTPTTPVEQT
ncbi:MAG TPA: SGNH/GDSL hydrolase family protein [Micromonosporaceae bacterium]